MIDEINYDDLAQEALKKWPQIEVKRLTRAVSIARTGMILLARFDEKGNMIKTPTIEAYAVKSETRRKGDKERTWYIVRPRAHSCNCPDGREGHICKHRLAVWLYTELPKRLGSLTRQCRKHPGIYIRNGICAECEEDEDRMQEPERLTPPNSGGATPPTSPARRPQRETLQQLGY